MGSRIGFLILALALPAGAQTTWHVDVAASPPGNGSAESPYVSIQRAIANGTTQSGDRILVAPGTYLEAIDFLGKTLVLRATEGAANTVIDGSLAGNSVILVAGGEGPGTRIEGFTITGGDPASPGYGGGLRCEGSAVEVRECTFVDLGLPGPAGTLIEWGGGAAVLSGELELVRCRFVRCRADVDGGAVFASASTLRVDHCSFSDCETAYGDGGAIAALGCALEIVKTAFHGNVAHESQGGALHVELGNGRIADCELTSNRSLNGHQGGALATAGGTLEIERCLFLGNEAAAGGAIRASSALSIRDCRFEANEVVLTQQTIGGSAIHAAFAVVQVERSVFFRNRAFGVSWSDEQGAVYGCALERCTLVENVTLGAYPGSAAAASTLRNCIVWDNLPNARTISSSTVSYSDVDAPTPGIGNISADPRFVDQASGDLRLLASSPCIDAGDPASAPDPDGSRADMGAFPFHPEYGIPPENGCQGKVTSHGCEPYMGHNGVPPSVSEGSFVVYGRNEPFELYGILIWSLHRISVPFQGGTLCVGSPVQRTPTQETEVVEPGSGCGSEFSFAWTSIYLARWGLAPGTDVHCQFWGRDAADPWRSSLTDSLTFQLVP